MTPPIAHNPEGAVVEEADEYAVPPRGWQEVMRWGETCVAVRGASDPFESPVLLCSYGDWTDVTEFPNLAGACRCSDELLLGLSQEITLLGALLDHSGGDWPFREGEVRIDPNSWQDLVFRERATTERTVWINGEEAEIQLWSFPSSSKKLDPSKVGTPLLIESSESSMSTGEIGAFVSIDEWGATWGQLAGVSMKFIGFGDMEPVAEIGMLFDGSGLPPASRTSSIGNPSRRFSERWRQWSGSRLALTQWFGCATNPLATMSSSRLHP